MPAVSTILYVFGEIGAATGGGPYKRMKQPRPQLGGIEGLIIKQKIDATSDIKLTPVAAVCLTPPRNRKRDEKSWRSLPFCGKQSED